MIDGATVEAAAGRAVSRETFDLFGRIVSLVLAESANQNLISARTTGDIWSRHILDSVQLLRYADKGPWLDLGTGAGFPGLVIAAFDIGEVVLCEERRLRHEFLNRVIVELGLKRVRVAATKLERLPSFAAATISARAFAPLDRLFKVAHRFSTEKTQWVLPKGQSASEELASVRAAWHGDFRLEPSVTDPAASILVAENIRPRNRR